MFALQNQLYLLLPMEAARVGGSGSAVAAVFLVSTVASLLLQVRITRYFQLKWSRGRSIAAGLMLMGLAFLATAVGASTVPAGAGGGLGAVLLRLSPVLLATLLLTAGLMLAQPFVNELIPEFGDTALSGTYFGVFYLASGVTAAAGNAAIGWLSDSAGARLPWAPSTLCTALGVTSALAVFALARNGFLEPNRPAGERECRKTPTS